MCWSSFARWNLLVLVLITIGAYGLNSMSLALGLLMTGYVFIVEMRDIFGPHV